jgi:ubiquinone/menaquinone biosynthesis C-methylase UbiE
MHSFFEMIADIYDETRGFPSDTMKEIIDVMDRKIGDKKILDLGVGTGRFAYPLHMRGRYVVGVDLSQSMLGRARSKGLDGLVIGDACHLPFRDSAFDFVISVHLLHLVDDCSRVLKEIKRVGKGILISVLFKRSAFNAMEEYREALLGYGYHLTMPGFREIELKNLAEPESVIPISEFESLLPIKERIGLLEERKHSYSLEIPVDIHNDAIRYLKNKQQEHLDDHAKTEVEVAFWDINKLPSSIIY